MAVKSEDFIFRSLKRKSSFLEQSYKGAIIISCHCLFKSPVLGYFYWDSLCSPRIIVEVKTETVFMYTVTLSTGKYQENNNFFYFIVWATKI